MLHTIHWRTAALAAVALLVLGLGLARMGLLSRGGAKPGTVRAPLVDAGSNLVLISIDTLRADHLPAYGYTGVETPALTRLAREGVVMRSAFTPVPLTLPAHCSLMTGLLPVSHAVRDNSGFQLDSSIPTLAAMFKAHGYRTGAFVSAFVLDSRWGLGAGFDEYVDDFAVTAADLAGMAGIQRRGDVTWASARAWLEAAPAQPFFMWLHLFDPHTPYDPPERFASQHRANLYDGEIAYADSIVADAIARLEHANVLDKTVVIVVGDHGEGLGDHGEDEHGLLAYDSTLRVPWIMRLPGGRHGGRIVDEPASLVDVMPTVAEMFGYSLPRQVDGASRVAAIGSGAGSADVLYAETFYPRLHFGWSELTTTRDGRFKYIRAPRAELYDTSQDPGETVNVIAQHRDVADRLDKILGRIMSEASAATTARAVDPDATRRLTALGYVTGGGDARAEGPRADPKDKMNAYRALIRARQLLDTGNAADGLRMLETLVGEEPDLEAAHRALREHWGARGHTATAIAKFSDALRHRPNDALLLYDLAFAYRAANDPLAALRTLDRILSIDPRHVEALRLSGEIATTLGRGDQALEYFTRAAQAQPDSDELAVKVAQAQLRLGRRDEADAQLRRTIERHPDAEGAHYLAAQIAEERGDSSGAEREYRREIELHPWDYQARFNLAMILGRRQAFDEQATLLDSIPPIAPSFNEVHFYRAKAYLDTGNRARLPDAIAAAQTGLRLAPTSAMAALGHYVLADVYRLQGRGQQAAREMERGRALEARMAGRDRLR